MKLHVHNFKHNSPKNIGDIITSVSYETHPSGIIRVRFTTKDKYYSVDGEWSAHTPDYKGQGIKFMPYIYDGNSYLDPYDTDCDKSTYYDHPDWWMLKLVLETDKYYESKVIPLKHEYLWVLIPQDIVFGSYDKMKPLEIINEHLSTLYHRKGKSLVRLATRMLSERILRRYSFRRTD